MPYDESKESCQDIINGMRRFVERQRNDQAYKAFHADELMEATWDLILSYARRFENALKRMENEKSNVKK